MLQLQIEENDRHDLPASARELHIMFVASNYHARRIVRKLGIDNSFVGDIEQDILVTLLDRRRYFDPVRGPWTPFVLRIAGQAAQLAADRLSQEKRTFVSVAAEGSPAIEDEDGTSFFDTFEDPTNPNEADFLYRLLLMRAIKRLPPELGIILEAALDAEGELAEVPRALGLSTSEFYRRLKELRFRLVLLGLAPRRMIADL